MKEAAKRECERVQAMEEEIAKLQQELEALRREGASTS